MPKAALAFPMPVRVVEICPDSGTDGRNCAQPVARDVSATEPIGLAGCGAVRPLSASTRVTDWAGGRSPAMRTIPRPHRYADGSFVERGWGLFRRDFDRNPSARPWVRSGRAVFRVHEGGKLTVRSTLPLVDRDSLSLAYTPGVAEVCMAIHADEALARRYTWRSRLVAVVSDGTAVLGLGNIGRCRPAGDGGQGRAVQRVRRAERRPDRAVDDRPGRDRRDRRAASRRPSAASTSRTSPRRAVSRSRLGCATGSTSRCSTTTSTARRSSCSPRCATRRAVTGRTLGDLRVVVSGAGRPASRARRSCSPPASATSPSPTRAASCTPARRPHAGEDRPRRDDEPLRAAPVRSPTRWPAPTCSSV